MKEWKCSGGDGKTLAEQSTIKREKENIQAKLEKMGKVFFGLLFCLFFSCSDQKGDQHKMIIEKDRFGNIILKAQYYISSDKDTLVDGDVIYYYPDGTIEDSFKMVNGLKNGFYFQFDSTGHLKSKMNFSNNKLDGYSYTYFPNGVVETEQLSRSDSILYSKNYFLNGQLKSYFIFINKKESRYYLIYDSSGKKIEEAGDSSNLKSW